LKISVVTAVYNRQQTVEQALDSVLSRTYPGVESIVIDCASTDGTLAVLEQYRARLGVFVSERDQGIYDALNKCIKHAAGDVVGFLHADDVFENREVLSKVAVAFQDPVIDAVYADLVYIRHDDLGQLIRYWKSGHYDSASLSRGWMPPHPMFYVRRSVYELLPGTLAIMRVSSPNVSNLNS
jgi:glycosyltransferase involved in cell wall biosynthesis